MTRKERKERAAVRRAELRETLVRKIVFLALTSDKFPKEEMPLPPLVEGPGLEAASERGMHLLHDLAPVLAKSQVQAMADMAKGPEASVIRSLEDADLPYEVVELLTSIVHDAGGAWEYFAAFNTLPQKES